MIVCEHSKVEFENDNWKIHIPPKIGGVIGIFSGQTLFGYVDPESGRTLISPLKLSSTVSYFRMFLDDVRGSLTDVTKLFADRNLNILSGGAFSFGNIWMAELLVDFGTSGLYPDEIVSEISNMGGFITSREITELFPVSFNLSNTYTVEGEAKNASITASIEANPVIARSKYAVIKAWPRIRAIFIDFFGSESNLIHISAKIKDEPASLFKLTEIIGAQVNLNAVGELHHDAESGVWNAYGALVMGDVDGLIEKALSYDNIITFEAKLLK